MNRIVSYITIAFFLIARHGSCQNENSKWYFGRYAALDFLTSPPGIILSSAMFALEGSSSVADAAGNLLFYTDGLTVYDQSNSTMANGTGLYGNLALQSCISVKKPGSATLYYIFTMDGGLGLNYSVVDMSLAAGLGSVTVLNSPVYNNNLCTNKISATRHCNGVDSWIVVRDFGVSSNFRAFLLTSAGLNPVPVISAVSDNSSVDGILKFSPNGRKLAGISSAYLALYDFDNATGIVSNPISLPAGSSGCEFSPDGTKLYASTAYGLNGLGYISQLDLCAGPAIAASLYTISATTPQTMQRAPDGKIYIAQGAGNSNQSGTLSVINNPNIAGTGCNFNNTGLVILPGTTARCLPNLTDFYLQPPVLPPFTYTANIIYGCYTASFTAPSELQDYPVGGCLKGSGLVKNMTWDFGDPASGSANTSTLTNPSHTYLGMGTFTTMLVVNYGCGGGIDTLYQQVFINLPCVSISSSITCASLGSATVSTTGGTGPYAYTWTPTGQTGSVATGLSPGTYTIAIRDLATNAIYTITTTLVSSIPLTGTIVSSYTMDCPNTGSASVGLSGGSGNQGYNWTNGLTSYTTGSANNLGSGTWSLTATDLLTGCQFTKTLSMVSLNPPPPLTASGSTVCTGQGISLNAITSGTAVVWTGPQAFGSTQLSPLIANATPAMSGNYTVKATSAQGCTNMAVANVNVLPPPSLTVSLSSNSLCAQALNGSPNTIILTSGGANTYTLSTPIHIYNPNPAGPNSPLSLLPPYQMTGPATATLFGSNGVCTVSTTAVFTIIPNPTVTVSSPTPVICAGQSYTYTSQGADSFTWSATSPGSTVYTTGNAVVASPTINSVFSVSGSSLGCNSALQSSILTVNPLPQLLVNPLAQVCKGESVKLTASGTSTSYTWSPNLFLNTATGATVNASPPAGQSYVIIGSLNNCTTSAIITVSVMPLPIASITTTTQKVCENENIVLQGGGGLTFTWSGPTGVMFSGQTAIIKPFSAGYTGVYTLTVSDANNCKGSNTQSITVYNLPQGYFDPENLKGCAPFCSSLDFKTNPGAASITGLSWQVNGQDFTGDNFKYCFNTAGNYKITGQLSDINNCVNTQTYMVNVYPRPEANFSYYPQNPVENFDEVNFSNISIGEQLKQFNWYFINNSGYQTTRENPTYLFTDAGTYPVALVVSNSWGCQDSVVEIITIDPDIAIYIPNTFTPNADGLNELFGPVMRGINNFTLAIFDRWGEKIFETSEIGKGWDGSFKGQPCQQGIYAWKLKADSAKTKQNLSGQVLLYR